ncbi:MAG: serine hydrolase [Leptospira sp.]|nr:serine hydrolase [Leptospira sp.]NCS94262.1 serine hydrolase [Leptospira sp.]
MNQRYLISILLLLACNKPAIELKPYGDSIKVSELKKIQRDYWPTQAWKSASPESLGMNTDKLQEMEKYSFTLTGNDEDRLGIRTDSVVIIYKGKLVYEKYAREYKKDQKHLLWSVAKSYINTLVGIAVRDGLMKLDDFAYEYVPELSVTEEHKKITINHLLTMTSGLDGREGYESNPMNSTVIAMLYTKGRSNMGAYCSSLPIIAEPGKRVYYSSCDTNILSLALQNVYGKEKYLELPNKELFNILGIRDLTWEKDGSDVYVGSSYIYSKPTDVAKFAFLYLNNGYWNGKKILPDGWVTQARTPSEGYKTTKYYPGLEKNNYTAQWYANTGVPDAGIPKPMPDIPSDTFFGSGHWGQRVFIIPSLDLIVVRFADDRKKEDFSDNDFLKPIVESVQ